MLAIAAVRLGFGPVVAVDVDRVAVETTRANAAANGVTLEVRRLDALQAPCRGRTSPSRTSCSGAVEAILVRLDAAGGDHLGHLVGDVRPHGGWAQVERPSSKDRRPIGFAASTAVRRCGDPYCSELLFVRCERQLVCSAWRPSRRFLGCKVSFADMQAIRDGCSPRVISRCAEDGEIEVVNTCCVTHEAVSKSRRAAARGALAREVYVTGCASNLHGAFDGAAPKCRHAPHGEAAAAFVAGDVGAIACVNAEHRLDRVRAFVKIQDGCSFSCAFCVIPLVRGATRSRTAAAVLADIRRRVEQGHAKSS